MIIYFSSVVLTCSYEGALDPWMLSLWRVLSVIKPELFPNGADVMIPNDTLIDQPKVQITYHNTDIVESQVSTASGNMLSNSLLTCIFHLIVKLDLMSNLR